MPRALQVLPRPAAALLIGLAAACGGDDDDDDVKRREDTGPEVDADEAAACAGAAEPGPTLVPGRTLDTTVPAIVQLEAPYTVQLSQGAGGYFRVQPGGLGEVRIYSGAPGAINGVFTGAGAEVAFTVTPGVGCPDEIAEVVAFPISEDTLWVRTAPSPYPSSWTWMVLVAD